MAAELLDPKLKPEEEWPVLIPLDTPHLPRLEARLLPGWAGEFAHALAEATETPVELAIGMVMTACSTAAARQIRVTVAPGYSEPTNLWIVVALPPGNRKSAVQSETVAPLIEWEREQATLLVGSIQACTSARKTEEARANQLRAKAARTDYTMKASELAEEAAHIEANLTEIPKAPQLWTSDATPEKLGVLLANNNEHMSWLSSEGGIFDLLQGRYSNGIPNLDLILKAHSGDSERVDRGSRPPIFLQRPSLCVGLSPQPETLRGLATKPGFRGRGLLARFLYLLPPSLLGFRTLKPCPIPPAVVSNYRAGIRAMLGWGCQNADGAEAQVQQLKLSQQAFEEWQEFAHAIELRMRPNGEMENFTDWAGKAPGAAARIAGVLHAIEHSHGTPWSVEISQQTMQAALAIQAVLAKHSLAALDLMGADPNVAAARVLWKWLESRRLSQLPVTEIHKALRGSFSLKKHLMVAISVLIERGYVDLKGIEPNQRRGRPKSAILRVRPEIVETWT